MTRLAAAAAAFLGATAVLALAEGDARTWGFRALVVAVGIASVRALVRWHGGHPPAPAPFRRARRRRRTRGVAPRRGTERVVHLATVSAGDLHRGLRPLLREIADERLRATRGVSIDDPATAEHLAGATWALLRPDRPPPHDVRAPGITDRDLDALLTDLEAL